MPTLKTRPIPFLFAVTLLLGSAILPASAAPNSQHDMDVLSRRMVEPLTVMELRRHLNPSQCRRASREVQAVNDTETRLAYTYNIQLADGSQMSVPESYDVTRTAEHATAGIYTDLTIYRVRREGADQDLVLVGLTPDAKVVVLDAADPHLSGRNPP